MTAPQPIESLDFMKEIKEMQLQHGLRSDDYARYHKYLSRRLHTLRSQLNLSNGKKQFLNKQVTVQSATDARHIMLVALEAERAWASSEEIRATLAGETEANENNGASRSSMQHHERTRANKAAKWAQKLLVIVDAVGTPELKGAVGGYVGEMQGRCALTHGDFAAAKKAFQVARGSYYNLHASVSQSQWALVVAKVRECDDRVVYAMQRLGEAIHGYNPPTDKFGAAGEDAAKVSWLGRQITVYSVKVKELLRAADESEKQREAFQTRRDAVATLNAQPKVLEFFDRSIGFYNDAISHSEQDIRDNNGDRTQLQLLEHYLRYQLHHVTLTRTLFMVDIYARRFRLTSKALESGGPLPAVPVHTAILSEVACAEAASSSTATTSGWTLAQAASPAEVVHLYDQAIEAVNKMTVLPGVEDDDTLGDEVNDFLVLARAGRLLYLAEGWRIVESRSKALSCFLQVEKVLKEVSKNKESQRRARILLKSARTAVTRIAAEQHLSSSSDAVTAAAPSQQEVATGSSVDLIAAAKRERVLAEVPAGDATFTPYKTLVRLPPDYQSIPCKPTFVDVASTFIDMPGSGADVPAEDDAAETTTTTSKKKAPVKADTKPAAAAEDSTAADEGGEKKGWFSGWGWKGKK